MTRLRSAGPAPSNHAGYGVPSLAVLFALVAANLVFLYVVIVFEHHHVHEENSLLEGLQAAVLAYGALLYLAAARAGSRSVVCLVLALLSFSFFLREVDVEHLPLPELLRVVGSGNGKVVLLLALWAPLALHVWRRVVDDPVWVGELVRSVMMRVLVAVVMLLLVSFVMDREYLVVQHARLYEELAETNAYLLMICGGLASVRGLYWNGRIARRAPDGTASA